MDKIDSIEDIPYLFVGQQTNEDNIVKGYIQIALYKLGIKFFRLVACVDIMIDYDENISSDEDYAVRMFKKLQIEYFGKIINDDDGCKNK